MDEVYTADELKKVQELAFLILKDVHNVCMKNNIEYFIHWGTLLGASRHGGFIPWDDDIDIAMTWDNYKKFKSIANKELPNYLFYQDYDSDPDYPQIFAKVRMNNTTYSEWKNRNLKMHQGIFIDIFPMHNIPEKVSERSKFVKRLGFLDRLYFFRQCPSLVNKPENVKDKIKQIVKYVFRIPVLMLPRKFITKKIDQLFEETESFDTDYVTYIYDVSILNKSMIFPLKEISFENSTFLAPNNIHQILTETYGRYLELPKEEYRIGHKPYRIEVEKMYNTLIRK